MSPSLRPVMGLRLDKVVAPDTHFSGSSDEPSPFVNISNFTKPSSRIFNRRDWQASSFTTLARLMISRTVSAFSRSALRIFSRSFSITRLLAVTDDTNDGDDFAHPQLSRCYETALELEVSAARVARVRPFVQSTKISHAVLNQLICVALARR